MYSAITAIISAATMEGIIRVIIQGATMAGTIDRL
jgi:hypothetical protein